MIIPAIKSTVKKTVSTVTFIDGVVITLDGSNTIATRKDAYIKAVSEQVPVIEQPIETKLIQDLARDIYVMEDAKIVNGLAVEIPSRKGGYTMYLAGKKPKLGSATYQPSTKGIFIDNEPECWYETNAMPRYQLPSEFHFIVNVAAFFDFESPFNIYGIYIGLKDGGKVRLKNGKYDPVFPENMPIPLNQNVVIRMRYLPNGDGEVYINNKKLSGSLPSFFSGSGFSTDRLGFGTPQNNSFYNYIAVYGFDKALSEQEANDVFDELSLKYAIQAPSSYPILKNCTVTFQNGIAKISGNYSGANKEKSRTIKWVTAGNEDNPDVTNSVYDERLNGLSQFSIWEYNLNGFHVRPVVTITDEKGITGLPSSKGFVRIFI